MKIRTALCATLAVLTACAGTLAAAPTPSTGLDRAALRSAVEGVRQAGVPGVYAEVRASGDGVAAGAGRTWSGASGVADLGTGRPVRPDMRHRVGSITKTFTAVAVMQQVEQGRIRLDAPIGDHLPLLVPGERGKKITVRMLLNNSSGIPDYIPYAFPSLQTFPSPASAQSLDDNRFRTFRPAELIALGLAAPPTGEPGAATGVYSNTNYLLLGQLLERTTGTAAEVYITRHVIERAGLRNTEFPSGTRIDGPHSRMYESLYGVLDPPRDYSVYDMSWTGTGAALVSTMEDLNRFYAKLLDGRLVNRRSLTEMQRTIPVRALDGSTIQYGLGLHKVTVPGCGTFWGHDGTVWGARTMSLTRADGKRQMSVGINLERWNRPDSSGRPQHHPIDDALSALYRTAMCATTPEPAP
ncbi:serine hydrolase domain-containing protein [Streptomyces sp. A0592]|uniref:serine hydrolase domain-containing protein n=1 Tax=Streptomyces sp. A0592 TaxID=2563099 RepID=UPI00109E91DB|nr:serine hydrolase domain-containing protein [Streptomyces sp. A0592]THA74386.1 class A beta-lactamase-related serine hydrolase [Streptomyces sp. A0592]